MTDSKRLIMFNQMAGPLFRELAEGIADFFPDGVVLHTGHLDTLSADNDSSEKLIISSAPSYDRRSSFHRVEYNDEQVQESIRPVL